jgi:hypothetical protein
VYLDCEDVMKCKTCKWWKESNLKAERRGGTLSTVLGYCEPPFGRWKGLTAADYSCPEHEDKSDAD